MMARTKQSATRLARDKYPPFTIISGIMADTLIEASPAEAGAVTSGECKDSDRAEVIGEQTPDDGLIIDKKDFAHLAPQAMKDLDSDLQFRYPAFSAFQAAIESSIIRQFQQANAVAARDGRDIVTASDFELAGAGLGLDGVKTAGEEVHGDDEARNGDEAHGDHEALDDGEASAVDEHVASDEVSPQGK